MKLLKVILLIITYLLGVLGIFFGFIICIGLIQERLFLQQDYLMWIFKFPLSRLVFIYELYLVCIFFYIFNKDVKWSIKKILNNRYKNLTKSTFIIINIILFYSIVFNVTVIATDKIVNYSFFSPRGKEYTHEDVVKINTGVYGKKLYIPFTHSKGDFYYIIELKDGTKIDISESGGFNSIEEDPRFIIEKLDITYVDRGIEKISSMENFEYSTEHLGKTYTDKIKNILQNIKP